MSGKIANEDDVDESASPAGNPQELAAFFLASFVDIGDEIIGAAAVDDVLSAHGLTRAMVRDRSGWVSLRACEAVCEELAERVGDPAFFDRCGREALSRRAMGLMRPLLRAFGTPTFAYHQVVQGLSRFNKVGRMRILRDQPGFLELEYTCLPGAPVERSKYICATRLGQMSAFPTLFDLPTAHVVHPRCMHRGDDCCIYEISYETGQRGVLSAAAGFVGAALGAVSAHAVGAPPAVVIGGAITVGALGYCVARLTSLQRSFALRGDELVEAHDALKQHAHINEERYLALSQAKADVDQQVAERTARLQQTRDQLAEMLRRVEDLAEGRRRFFANVSHELRTPLQLILGPVDEMIAADPQGDDALLRVMRRNGVRLLSLVEHLLEVASSRDAEVPLRVAETEVRLLAATVVEDFSLVATQRGVALSFECALPAMWCFVDEGWARSALTNLLANAIRLCGSGDAVAVSLAAGETSDSLVLVVSDTGPGIAPNQREAVFKRYVQGAAPGSAGLGLAIVAEAARLHGGSVTLESTEGVGSVFRVFLPGTRPTADDFELDSSEMLHPVSGGAISALQAAVGPSPGAPLALVVEDNADLRGFVVRTLAAGFRVLSAGDGESGLRLAKEHLPDVIVTDVRMPRMNGVELVRQLRACAKTAGAAIVVLTARRDPETVLSAYDAGADDFLSKPFHGRELLARVDVHLRVRLMLAQVAHSERLASVGGLAAAVAHQVRNPLNVIKNGIPLLLPGPLQGRKAELQLAVDDSIHRIEALTADLLQLSGVERSGVQPVHPPDGLQRAARMLRVGLADEVALVLDLEPDRDTRVMARVGELNHVWMNLIDNALRAVGDAGEVRVSARLDGGFWVIRVEDSGPGIAPDVAEQIFRPFYSTRAAGVGTGLGLAIAERGVREGGGSIRVETSSALGGAAFVVSLPAVLG